MRVISINVNGIRSEGQPGLFDWLKKQDADVICLQDTRASVTEMEQPSLQLDGYHQFAADAENPSDGGVAIYCRLQPKAVISSLGFDLADRHGRYLQADFDMVSIASLLLPSGQGSETKLNHKFKFMAELGQYLHKQRRKRRNCIYCSSLYIAHHEKDVNHCQDLEQQPGYLPSERQWLDQIIHHLGYIDALREHNSDAEQFSWWPDADQNEPGCRFDYHLLSPGLRNCVRTVRTPGESRFRQHAAVIGDYDWTLSL